MNLLARARATERLLAILPAAGIQLGQGQDLVEVIQARLTTPSTAAAPSAEQIESGAVALLAANGITVATGQTAAAAISAFVGELEQAGKDLTAAQASLATATTQLASATAQLSLYADALAKAGIKVVAKDAKAGITAADIDAAIAARISTKASELLAQTGTPPVTTQAAAVPGSEAAKPVSGLTGLARAQAAYEKKYPGLSAAKSV